MKDSLYAAADIGATGIKMAAAVYDGSRLRISLFPWESTPTETATAYWTVKEN